MRLSPGDVFAGKYRIERMLGEGGMGAVYVAVNERLQKRVALKVISDRIKTDSALSSRFTQEAIAASRVAHAGIVEIFDADQHLGTPWIAMELLEGESLGDRLARGPLPIADAVGLATRVLEALDAVHAAGIVHRDLKPDNIFCCTDGRIKVLDFGIAKLAIGEITGQTETGMALGTPFYLAPEQASSAKDVGPRADVYSMGVVLYQMVCGRLPYDASSLGDLVRQMYTTGPTSLNARAPHAPAALVGLVERCLAVDPMQRPSSAREVASALYAISAGLGATMPMPVAQSSTPATMALDSNALMAAMSTPGGFGVPPSAPHTYTAAAVPPAPEKSGLGLGVVLGGCALLLGLPLLLGLAGALFWIFAGRSTTEIAEVAPIEPADPGLSVRSLAPMAAADVPRARIDVEGAPARGGAEPLVTIVAFSEFQCPYCARVNPTLERVRETYGDRVRIVFRHQPLPMHADAMTAAEAAQEAFAQGGDARFWMMHDVLFENQANLGRASLERYASQVGLDLGRFTRALDTRSHEARVRRDMDAASTAGVTGTPSFFINGRRFVGAQPYESFSPIIDEEIALANALIGRGVPRSRLYETFQRDALARVDDDAPARPAVPAGAPDPNAIYRVPLGDSPVRGDLSALVTIVTFSEFQCPFCGRVQPTLAQLQERYGADLRIVFKHNPLAFHTNAMPAAELAVEAASQGRFWQVHDALFANQTQLDRATLERIARENGLDMARVRLALDGHTHSAAIARDQELARSLGASGTPAFFINGRNLRGAQPVTAFEQVIDVEMARARALVAAGTPRSAVYEAAIRDGLTAPAPAAPVAPVAPTEGDRYTLPLPARVPSRGPVGAPLTMQIISDFQCPFCSRAVPTVDQIAETYGSRVRIVFRHYPLPFHDRAMPAAEASVEVFEQAGDAGFWAYHDLLFENQRTLDDENLVALAARVRGVDAGRVRAALGDHRHRARVQADMTAVQNAGMEIGTPSFLIGTRLVSGAQPFAAFQTAIDEELARR